MMEWVWIGAAFVVIAILGFMFAGKDKKPKSEPRTASPAPFAHDGANDPARALFAAAGSEPPTEDQIAQARLGGTRGNPKLGSAPLAPQAGENIPHPIDDGHVA